MAGIPERRSRYTNVLYVPEVARNSLRHAQVALNYDRNRLAGLERCRRTLELSLADCYALALAKRLGGTIFTTDRELAKVREVDVVLFSVEIVQPAS